MANYLLLRWAKTSWILFLFACGLGTGQSSDLKCDFQPSPNYVVNSLFEVYTFQVEEGILLEPGKVIGQITLVVDNFTNSFAYDEPYFSKPYNKKSSPLPEHFNIIFTNVTVQNTTSTTTKPRHRRNAPTMANSKMEFTSTADSTKTYIPTLSTFPNNKTMQNTTDAGPIDVSMKATTGAVSTTPYFESTVSAPTPSQNATLSNLTTPMTENVTSHVAVHTTQSTSNSTGNVTSSPSTTSQPATASTPAPPPSECVVAQIVQMYDLDREKQDTHYLTINEADNDWGVPTIIKLEVTDINDNSPIFVEESLSSIISKDVRNGEIVGQIKATDADIGKNAELRFDYQSFTERRGNETESPDLPTFLIHDTSGLIVLFGSIDDLEPPTKITFRVVVKDRGDEKSGNRATASATVSIVDDSWTPEPDTPHKVSGGVIAACVMGGVIFIGLCFFVVFHCARKKFTRRSNGQLEFMLDDENLISA